MRVIKNKQIIEDDWSLWTSDGAVPQEGALLLCVDSYRACATARTGKTGLLVRSHDAPDSLGSLDGIELIAVEFPKFADGRGYTIARLLRERMGYRGELRAVGEVLRDQLFYMARCGFDSFALKSGKDENGALLAFDDFSTSYQGAADDPRPLFRRVAR